MISGWSFKSLPLPLAEMLGSGRKHEINLYLVLATRPEHFSPRAGPQNAPRPGPRLEWKFLCFAVTESSLTFVETKSFRFILLCSQVEYLLKQSLWDFFTLQSSRTFVETRSFRFFFMSFFAWRDNINGNIGKMNIQPFVDQKNADKKRAHMCITQVTLHSKPTSERLLGLSAEAGEEKYSQNTTLVTRCFLFSRHSRIVEWYLSHLVSVTFSYLYLTLKLIGSSNIRIHRRSGYSSATQLFASQEPAE